MTEERELVQSRLVDTNFRLGSRRRNYLFPQAFRGYGEEFERIRSASGGQSAVDKIRPQAQHRGGALRAAGCVVPSERIGDGRRVHIADHFDPAAPVTPRDIADFETLQFASPSNKRASPRIKSARKRAGQGSP